MNIVYFVTEDNYFLSHRLPIALYAKKLGHEVFVITPEIEQMILSGKVSEYEMEKIAIKDGMVTMVQDGVLKAMDGITTLEEIFRVIE